MPAQKPQRPDPGHAMLLPRTGADPAGNTVQRAFDAVSTTMQQVQKTVAANESAGGRLLAPQLVLTGAGSGTLPAGTCVVALDMIGQGGGGGGAINGSAAASGGLSGWRLRISIGTPGVPLSTLDYTWSAGSSGGGGGSAAGGGGAAGADTTATINGTTYKAKGGSGGIGSTGTGAVSSTPIAAPGTGPAGLASFGQAGPGLVMALSTAGLIGGAGGGTDLGAGGEPIFGAPSNGNAGSTAGFGGGGGGAVAINPAGFVGGAGAPGVVLLTPYS